MRQQGRSFQGWSEGPLSFPPTFKYKRGTSFYIGRLSLTALRIVGEGVHLAAAGRHRFWLS